MPATTPVAPSPSAIRPPQPAPTPSPLPPSPSPSNPSKPEWSSLKNPSQKAPPSWTPSKDLSPLVEALLATPYPQLLYQFHTTLNDLGLDSQQIRYSFGHIDGPLLLRHLLFVSNETPPRYALNPQHESVANFLLTGTFARGSHTTCALLFVRYMTPSILRSVLLEPAPTN